MNALDTAIARVPRFAGLAAADFEIMRLAGLTNDSYRLRRAGEDWVLRVPRAATNEMIDRVAERHNQRIAVALGLAPATRWDGGDGTTLTPTLAAARDLRPKDLDDAAIRGRAVEALRRLHRSERRFRGRVDLAALLERYAARLPPRERESLAPRLEQSQRVLGRLETEDVAPVPSHNDLVLQNLLFDGDRVWLIDWEYSAMASPYWDLATLANAAGFDLARSQRLLLEYGAGAERMDESILFDYRGLLRLLDDLWMAALARADADVDA